MLQRQPTVECPRCGRVRAPSARTEDGAPLGTARDPSVRAPYAAASITSPPSSTATISASAATPHPCQTCGRCGRERRVATRHQSGVADLCHSCYRTTIAECALCQQRRPVHTMTWPIGPVCRVRYRREPATRPTAGPALRGGHSSAATTRESASAGRVQDRHATTSAQRGAAGEQHFENTCVRCSVFRASSELLAAATGAIPGHLTGLPNALVHRGRVDSTMRWLLKPTPRALLQAIGAQESITHASVDASARAGATSPPAHPG